MNQEQFNNSMQTTKNYVDSTIQDYTGGKKQVYLTQAEYDLLSDTEKNDITKVYNITDAVEQVIPSDLMINDSNLLQLKDANGNAIGTGVTVSTTSGGTSYTLPIASSTVLGGIKVGSNLNIDSNGVLSATVIGTGSGMTDDEVDTVLTNVFGESYLPQVYGNIIASVSKLSINEGESATFTISLSQAPTRPQTISIVSDNTDVTVNPSSIAISDTNPHTITVSVAEDEDYADETATLTLSSPEVSNVTINVAIKDNDIEPKPCTGISLNQETVEVEVGKSKQLIATVTPEGCTDEIVWRASNENCTVVNGLVKAVTEGDCVITATCGSKSAICTVTVTEAVLLDSYVDDASLVFDLNLKNLGSEVTTSVVDSKQGITFNVKNNDAGQRNTPQGMLLNGQLQADSKSANSSTLATLLDANTDGVTIEYFGNYFPGTICLVYDNGFNIASGSTGYNSGVSCVTKYYNTSDEIKSYESGTSTILINPDDSKEYNMLNSTGKEATHIEQYSHIIVELYQDGTSKMFVNGFELKRTKTDGVVDFKEINFTKQFSTSYYIYVVRGELGADTPYYISSLRMYNRLLTTEEKTNNKNYELNACGLN